MSQFPPPALPLALAAYAIVRPSGDQAGNSSTPMEVVTCVGLMSRTGMTAPGLAFDIPRHAAKPASATTVKARAATNTVRRPPAAIDGSAVTGPAISSANATSLA